MEGREPFCTTGWECKLVQPLRGTAWRLLGRVGHGGPARAPLASGGKDARESEEQEAGGGGGGGPAGKEGAPQAGGGARRREAGRKEGARQAGGGRAD